MSDLVPLVLSQEVAQIKEEIADCPVSVAFDGITRLSEAMAVVLPFVDSDFCIQQRLVRMQLLTTLSFNNQSRTLTCTSTGGPATTVTWRDGAVIALSATYQTVLTIDPSVNQSDFAQWRMLGEDHQELWLSQATVS